MKSKVERYSIDDDKIIRHFAGKKSALDIGKILGRTRQGVLSRAKKLGVSLALKGEKHHHSKYSSTMVEWVRQLDEQGIKTSVISRHTKINYRTIRHWIEFRGRRNDEV